MTLAFSAYSVLDVLIIISFSQSHLELFCDVSQTLEGKQYVTLENRILFSPEASSHRKNFKCYLMVLILTPRVYSLLVNEVDAIRVQYWRLQPKAVQRPEMVMKAIPLKLPQAHYASRAFFMLRTFPSNSYRKQERFIQSSAELMIINYQTFFDEFQMRNT